jgi:polysaccharide export outer membrane protein
MNRGILIVLPLAAFLYIGIAQPALARMGQATANQASVPAKRVVSQENQSARPEPEEFVIGTGDVLAINVWKEQEISKVVPVRSDGRISLPLIGEVVASGKTPKQLEAEVSKRLRDFVADPEVTVVVQEIKSQKFNVLGMVAHPGSFPLTKPMTVVDAIATAGGFRDFAKQKDIYILRRDASGKDVRFPFNYKDVIKGVHSEQNIELQTNDTVVVP